MSHRSRARKARTGRQHRSVAVFTNTDRIAVPWLYTDDVDELKDYDDSIDELARSERIDDAARDMVGTVNDNTNRSDGTTSRVLEVLQLCKPDEIFTIDALCKLLPDVKRDKILASMAYLISHETQPYLRVGNTQSGRYRYVTATGRELRRLKAEQPKKRTRSDARTARVAGATTSAQPASRPAKRRPADPVYTVVTVGDCSDDTRCVIMRDEDGNLWDCLLIPVKPGVSFS